MLTIYNFLILNIAQQHATVTTAAAAAEGIATEISKRFYFIYIIELILKNI